MHGRLAEIGVPEALADTFWGAVRANLVKVSDAAPWWAVVAGPIDPAIADPALAEAAGALATARAKTEAWDEQDRKDKEWETGDAQA